MAKSESIEFTRETARKVYDYVFNNTHFGYFYTPAPNIAWISDKYHYFVNLRCYRHDWPKNRDVFALCFSSSNELIGTLERGIAVGVFSYFGYIYPRLQQWNSHITAKNRALYASYLMESAHNDPLLITVPGGEFRSICSCVTRERNPHE